MKLLSDWKSILKKAWSVRFMALAVIFTAAEVALPLYVHDLPRALFASLSGLAIVGAMLSRLVAQKEFDNDA